MTPARHYFTFKTFVWVHWDFGGTKQVRKKLNPVPDMDSFQIKYGLTYNDGPWTGVVSKTDGQRFFFECVQNDETYEKRYIVFCLTEEQWAQVDEEIALFESTIGTNCRYIDGKRNWEGHPSYVYRSDDASWKRYCSLIGSRQPVHYRLFPSEEQIIGFLTPEQLYNKTPNKGIV